MPLTAGAAKLDITPADLTALNPIGGGTFSRVHDPIFVRVLVLNDGTTETALISADLIEAGEMTPVRRRIERELGIPFDHILITATHAHNAPRIGRVSPGSLAHDGGPESMVYTELVYDAMVEALLQARASAQPARFGLGAGTADVNVNRDEYADGGWFLGFNPDGPSDKTLWVIKFETLTGDPIAVLINYAVHSTVTLWTNEVSGDLAGAAARYVEEQFGGVALWTLGPAGDQDPRIALGKATGDADRDRAFAFKAMDAQGLIVGAEAVRVARGIKQLTSTARLAAAERVIECPVKKGVDVMDDMKQEDVPFVNLRLSLLLLNQIALTGVSGEVVTSIYWRLKKESPLTSTILISITNDRIGYIPEDAAFDRPTHEVNGCPILRGYAEDAIITGLTAMIESALR